MSEIISTISGHISLLLTVFTLIFAIYQWYKSEQRKKSDFLFQYMQTVLKENIGGLYQLDYSEDKKWYDEDFHTYKNRKIQYKIDQILYMLNYICYLRTRRLISEAEFSLFEYDILRLWTDNNQFVDYMYNLYHYSMKCKVKIPFYYLMIVGKEYIPKDFYDCNAHKNDKIYHDYIGF